MSSAEGWENTELSTTRARLNALIGDRRGTIVVLGFCSIVSGLAEATILALLAEIASNAAKGTTTRSNQTLGHIHIHASPGDPVRIAGGLAVFRS